MQAFRLDAQDEYTHTPTAEKNFNESAYVNAFDAAGRYGGWMRLGPRRNRHRLTDKTPMPRMKAARWN